MVDDIVKDAKLRMQKSISAFQSEISKMRTGRAHPSLLEHVVVNYYGTDTLLNQLASIHVLDNRTLGINAYDKNSIASIEKGILNANLGLNPITTGDLIRVPLPPLTEETRRNMIKIIRAEAEKARVAIRNIRRDANTSCKELVRENMISEDEERKTEDRIQQLTDEQIVMVDKTLTQKEADMLDI